MTELQKRLLTGIIGGILLIAIILLGGYILELALLLLSLEIVRELYNTFNKKNIKINIFSLILGCLLLSIFKMRGINSYLSIVFVLFISFLFLLFKKDEKIENLTFTIFSFIYGPFLLNLLSEFNKEFIFLVFIIAFVTDTFAYIVGSLFGKHKLIPTVSPNKSVEGALGGILGCLIITMFYLNYIKIDINITIISFIILSSIAGQIGDLMASKIKRIFEIKDYAKILPGHGGILDRFDSSIAVIPFVYMLQYFI